MIKIIKQLIPYLKFYKVDLVIVLIALLSVSASLLMLGQVFKYLIDKGLGVNYVGAINKSVWLICVLVIIFGVSSFLRSYFINNITEKIINKMRVQAYTKLLNLDIFHFENLKIGDVISRLTADLDLVSNLILYFLSFLVRNSVMLFGALYLMFFQSFKLSLIVIITIPIVFIPLLKIGRYVRVLSKDALQNKGLIAANLDETFSNIRTFYAFNQVDYATSDFKKRINSHLKNTSTRLKIRSLFFALSISIILLTITLVIWIGSTDIVDGKMSSGQMISFIYYALIAGMSAGGISEIFGDMQSPMAAVERVFELINFVPNRQFSINHMNSKIDLLNSELDKDPIIEFQEVSFSYPTRLNIKALCNISFKVPLNKFTGIVGRSGSGKSTIVQLLLKFYHPTSGIVTVCDHDICNIGTKDLRTIIGYVPQEPSIFSGSIKSNIAFSKPAATHQEILEVAELCGIMEIANALKDGLDTEIGERGVRLSGGQKQRIAISRALLYRPRILLLDEAMSALDSESESMLLSSINKLLPKSTIISIAHRISSVEHADKILVINKGCIVNEGVHSELLVQSELYRILCED